MVLELFGVLSSPFFQPADDASAPAYDVHGCVIASQTGARLIETFHGCQRRWVALRNGYVHLVDPDHARSNSSEEHRGDGFRLRKYRNQRTERYLSGDWQQNGCSAGDGPGLHVAQSCHIEVYRLTGDHGIALGDQAQ